MIRAIGLIAFMAILFSLGVACLLFSTTVQRLAVKMVSYGLTSRIDPLHEFVRSSGYLVNVNFVGIIAILCFGFLLWASTHAN